MPRTRFHAIVAIDEATGKFIWRLPIGVLPTAIADGYLLGHDGDNGIQYCIGKGKTQTTVTAPLTTIAKGTGVLIQGSVMDMSPGKPNTPAVSEEDMSMWMDYLYGQNATLINNPPKPEGVSVTLTAVDSDGNYMDIGTSTSSMDGTYGIAWTPPEEGIYKIVASFIGSESYWCSYGTTHLSVGPAVEDVDLSPIQGSVSDTYTMVENVEEAVNSQTMYIIVILVLVIIALIIALYAVLRQK